MQDPLTIVSKVRARFHNLQRGARWQFGFDRSFISQAKGARILVYHGICRSNPFRFNTLFVTLKSFERQLRLYKKYFHIVSLDDFYQQRFSKDKFTICLSFDDGFANNYKYVLPLLEQYQVPATFFITGIRQAGYDILWNDILSIAGQYGPKKFIFQNEEFLKNASKKYISASGKKSLNDVLRSTGFESKVEMIQLFDKFKQQVEKDYWLQMTPAEIKTLSASKWITVGSHSYYHNDLAKISGAALQEDLAMSKKYLEDVTGKEVLSIAFPYGSYSKEAISKAKTAGYSQLLATEALCSDDVNETTLKERFTINPFISNINQMHANIRGNYK